MSLPQATRDSGARVLSILLGTPILTGRDLTARVDLTLPVQTLLSPLHPLTSDPLVIPTV